MIRPWLYEVARQRHRDLLAAAERDRLGRRARGQKTHRRTVSYWLTFRRFREAL
jgi:hypothetical protein